MNPLRSLAAAFVAGSIFSVHAQPCWVDHVELSNGEVKVVFDSSFNGVASSDRLGKPMRDDNGARFLTLKDGQSGWATWGAHDTCTVTAQSREGRLGVFLDAISVPHGMPASTAKEFLFAQ